ncbi:MAG TPA: MFS transporter [Rhodanobacteraceae bacterium]|nr:MFS transporter [Rhodanobacteraceae bacterium]
MERERIQSNKLSVVEKVGYSLGDFAANLVFQTLLTFLAFFYTNVFRIPAGAAAAIIFVVGMVGAFVFTPLVGLAADRTHTRWGMYRPWILATAIPLGILSLLTFTTPDLGPDGKLMYALASYTLLVLAYVANNLPYAALSGVITGEMKERNSLSAYRFVAVMLAQFAVQVLLLPLVLLVGGGDQARGFRLVMTAFAVIGTVFLIITFFATRERVQPAPGSRATVATDLLDLRHNRPWLIMLAITVLVFINLALKGGMYVYYFKYYLSAASLQAFLGHMGYDSFVAGADAAARHFGVASMHWPTDPATSAFSLFNAGGILAMICGIGCSKALADRFGKRNVFGSALFASTLFLLAFFFFGPRAVDWVFVSYICHGFFYGITTPVLWTMTADVADYSEWRTGRRATAVTFSAMLCGLKAGLSIGGALVAGILAVSGFDAGATVQAPAVTHAVRLAVSIVCSVPFLASVALLYWYEIDKPMESRIEADLGQRRRQLEAEA